MQKNTFQWQTQVRDYELDRQGIVNNATYVNYLEETRNEYVRSIGVDFAEWVKSGYDFVVAELNIKYCRPLSAQDKFYGTAKISGYNEKLFYFEQELKRLSDDKVIAQATVHVACIDLETKRSCMPEQLKKLLGHYSAKI